MPPTTTPAPELDYRPSYLAAAITSLAVLVLYLITLAPSTAMWDASEYIAAAYVLGLPHPPGNPFFVLLGNVFTKLPIATDVAARINILAALSSAVSAGMWFLITERVLVPWLAARWQRIVGGVLAAVIGATAFTVWNQSVVNEKVYTVGLVGLAIISWLMIRWADDPDHPKADRLLILVAYLLGLGYANHMAGFLPGPAAFVAVAVVRPRTLMRWKLVLACVGALVLGMTPFLTQPIRAAHFPAINEGEPTGCVTEIALDCTFSSTTLERFEYNFNRGQYGPKIGRQAPFIAQIGMFWLYFKWQWLRDPLLEHQRAQGVLAALFLVLGLMGGWAHYQKDRRSFWYFGTFMLSITLILIYYLNFKYGASQAPELGDSVDREVRDRDYFYLWTFSAWGVWASLGLVYLWEAVAGLLGTESVKVGKQVVTRPARRSWLIGAPVLALAFIPLFTNWKAASRAGHTYTRDFAHDLLNSVEPYGILVTVGDNDTFPLWYAQEVEGIRKDVIVANTSLLNTDWYGRQLLRRPVYEYDAEAGPAIYRGKEWPKPSGHPLGAMTMEGVNAVPEILEVRQTMVFRHNDIVAEIRPQLIQRADLLVLQMIKESFPDRPMYFSRTSAGYGHQLGLGPYLLSQGLARRLLPQIPEPDRDTVLVQGEGWVDVPRTRALWNDVFEAPASLVRSGYWIDRPSVGIPSLYVITGAVLADALTTNGERQAADSVARRAERVAAAVGLQSMFGPIQSGPPPGLFDSVVGDSAQGLPVPITP